MKFIYMILITLFWANTKGQMPSKVSQEILVKPTDVKSGPIPFEKFIKKTMKTFPGGFTVYQDGSEYFLEIPASALNSDILVIGDIGRGFASNIARSSGIIRFNKAVGNNLNVIKEVYKETASPDFNQGIEELVQNSNLIPVSFVIPIEAYGKSTGSFIINITRQLMEGGELFSFKEVSSLSSPDAARSGVQQIKVTENESVFRVLRTQTIPGQSSNGSKAIDKAVAYMLDLVIQRLPAEQMTVRGADERIGFGTVNYNDFGKSPYAVKRVKVITKWNMKVSESDRKRYMAGETVTPEKPIKVFIDPITPVLFVPYIKSAIQQWNDAFRSAGFKSALVVEMDEKESWLSSGKIIIKWGGALNGIAINTITDPRSGEILAGKMNIDAKVSDDLLPSYFAKCGAKDSRIRKDLYDPEVRGEIMEWKVAQGLGELLGLVPNLHGSAAYTNNQLRSNTWLKDHGFTSSVTDDTQFNYVVQTEDKVDIEHLMPRVGAYDRMAINWAYRIFANPAAEKKVLASLQVSNSEMLFLEENKSNPFTGRGDLSSDLLEASVLGMKNIECDYPQIEKLTELMKNKDEDWSDYKLLSKAFQLSYQLYTDNVLSYIGGLSVRPVISGYNDLSAIYVSKNDQKKAMNLLNGWLFNGAPAWMQNKKLNLLNSESESLKMAKSAQNALRKLISPDVINNLIKAEYALGKDAYSVSDLFSDIDHYIFNDFDTTQTVDTYHMVMQTNFIYDLSTAVAKNNITNGLTDTNEVLHFYFVRTMAHLDVLTREHRHADTREHYQVIQQRIKRDLNQKPS